MTEQLFKFGDKLSPVYKMASSGLRFFRPEKALL